MASRLANLPLEVLLNISSFLGTPDYCNLRLTCSAVEKQVFDAFAKEYFSIKQFMIASISLEVLLAISKHPTLSSYLKKVIIGLDCLDHGHTRTAESEMIRLDQGYLIATGSWTHFLTAALRNLSNCHDIEVRDFNSRTKNRDDGIWRSHGAKHYERTGGRIGMRSNTHVLNPSVVFNQVVVACSSSGIECHHLAFFNRFDRNALEWPSLTIKDWFRADLKHTFRSLKFLALSFKAVYTNLGPSDPIINGDLVIMLRLTPQLEILRVNSDLALTMESWRSPITHDPLLVTLKRALPSTQIKSLELGKACFSEAAMVDLFASLPASLQHLTFYRVEILNGTWHSLVDKMKNIPGLSSVSLNMIALRLPRWSTLQPWKFQNTIAFKASASADDKMEKFPESIECKVLDRASLPAVLDDLAARMVFIGRDYQRKHFPHLNADSEDEDEDEEMDDEDDMDDFNEDDVDEDDDDITADEEAIEGIINI